MPNSIYLDTTIGIFATPTTANATTLILPNPDGYTSTVFVGTGFTYGANGLPTGGAITSVSFVLTDGMVALATLTNLQVTMADVAAALDPVLALRDAVTWIDVIDQDTDPQIFTPTQIRLPNTDGTFTDFIGVGLGQAGDSLTGTVTDIRQIASNGTSVLTSLTGLSLSLEAGAAALFDFQGGVFLWGVLQAGSNTLTGSNDGYVIGDNAFHIALIDGPGDDTIVLNGPGTVGYWLATSGVTVNLAGGYTTGGGGNDTLVNVYSVVGSGFDDVLIGTDFSDNLYGQSGNDWIVGGAGDDWLGAGAQGVDVLNGGDGFDTANFGDADDGIFLNVGAGVYAADGVWTVFQSIERYWGSQYNDTMIGDESENNLEGSSGDDIIIGLGGNDTLSGGSGSDWIDGGAGNDILVGGNQGVSIFLGGDGFDLVSYANAGPGLWIDMSAGVYASAGVWDVFYQSIEGAIGGGGNDYMIAAASGSALFGGAGADTLIGGVGNDLLFGGQGDDWIVGGAGDDTLNGGPGVDIYTAGTGADVFALGAANAGWDVAFDFNPAEDRFNLGGQQWLGLVEADWDGDGQNDDTMLGYAGGNFVALDVSGMTLAQWNALVIG